MISKQNVPFGILMITHPLVAASFRPPAAVFPALAALALALLCGGPRVMAIIGNDPNPPKLVSLQDYLNHRKP